MTRSPVIIAVFTLCWCAAGCQRTDPAEPPRASGIITPTDSLEAVADSLRKSTTQETCRDAVRRLNAMLARHEISLPSSPAGQADPAMPRAAGTAVELDSPTFTPLDGHHLHDSLLFRDVIQSLGLRDSGRQQRPLARAGLVFEWVCRHVRVVEPPADDSSGGENPGEKAVLPPAFVLQRGWGTAEERALVFLALLEQLGLSAVVLGDGADDSRWWAVGVVVAEDGGETTARNVYLFDHRLGIPLPASRNAVAEGPVTLAAFKDHPDEVLAAVHDPNGPGQDLAPGRVKELRLLRVPTSCSALTARMAWLDERWGPVLGVALVQHHRPDGIDAGRPAELVAGPAWASRHWLPRAEGGVDTAARLQREIARTMLSREALPPALRRLFDDLGQQFDLSRRLWAYYATPVVSLTLAEGMPRDLELRGRFTEATKKLVEMRDELEREKSLLEKEVDLEARIDRWWTEEARPAFAAQKRFEAGEASRAGGSDLEAARLRAAEVSRRGEKMLVLLAGGARAEVTGGQLLFLLAQCKHEQAERLQAAGAAGAEAAWRDAAYWWRKYSADAGPTRLTAQARLLEARARACLGERTRAAELLLDKTGLSSAEIRSRQYQARLLQAQKPPDTRP